MNKLKLDESSKEQFIQAFAPAPVQILRHSGQPDATKEELLARLRDAKTNIEFEVPTKSGSVMRACVITDISVTKHEAVEVLIRKKGH